MTERKKKVTDLLKEAQKGSKKDASSPKIDTTPKINFYGDEDGTIYINGEGNTVAGRDIYINNTEGNISKPKKPHEKKEVVVNISGNATVGGGFVCGDVYQNTTVKKFFKYTYQEGDLKEEQAAKIKQMVDDIVELEKITKRTPKTYAAVWSAFKKNFKVANYRKIREDDYDKAVAYLQRWRGRLKMSKSLPKKEPDLYRKKRYGDIFAISKNELGWTKKDVDNYIFDVYHVSSIRELSDKELENLYQRINVMKRNGK